jgi:hypothetical protein
MNNNIREISTHDVLLTRKESDCGSPAVWVSSLAVRVTEDVRTRRFAFFIDEV